MSTLSASPYDHVATILNFHRDMTKTQTVADLRDYTESGEPVPLTVRPSSLETMVTLTNDRSLSPSSAHESSAYDHLAHHTPPTTRGEMDQTETDLSATATVRCPEAAEDASIKMDSQTAQDLCAESPPPDKLNSNLLEWFDAHSLDELAAGLHGLQHLDNTAICKGDAAGRRRAS